MNTLIEYVRGLIDDPTAPYTFDDDDIKRYINKYRTNVYKIPLIADDERYLKYTLRHKQLSAVVIYAHNGSTVISSNDYTIDVINGILEFATKQTQYLYASYEYHDLDNSAADIWLAWAAKAQADGPYKIGDQQLPQGKESVEFCVNKSWSLRKSKSTGMSR